MKNFLLAFTATFFISILFKVPKKGLLVSSLLGGLGYGLYITLSSRIDSITFVYFIATFFITLSSEVFARVMKMPATIFTVPGIIPLVPGLGLYDTMMNLIQNNGQVYKTGMSTLLAIMGMAMAMVLTSVLTKGVNFIITTFYKKFKLSK